MPQPYAFSLTCVSSHPHGGCVSCTATALLHKYCVVDRAGPYPVQVDLAEARASLRLEVQRRVAAGLDLRCVPSVFHTVP